MTLINHQETDLNKKLAYDAHRGTSFSPEKRADQEISSYMAEMKAVSDRFVPFVTPINEAALKADLERYRQGYLKRLQARLAAQSRIISTMIAGPSNFPSRQMQKRNETEHRRSQELLEWREKALKHLNSDYNPVAIARRPIMSDEADAIEQLQTKIAQAEENHRLMKAVNRIVVSKKFDNTQKVAKIKLLGPSDELLIQMRRYGEGKFPSFTLTNSNARIKRMKGRIIHLEAEAAQPIAENQQATIDGTPVTIIENKDEKRLQLVFTSKPPKEIIKLLKSNGFIWAPSQDAWQRLLNYNARQAIEFLVRN